MSKGTQDTWPFERAARITQQRSRDAKHENVTNQLQQSIEKVTLLEKELAQNEQRTTCEIEALSENNTLLAKENTSLAQDNSRLRHKLEQLSQKESKARYDAYHDELTGLPNRRLLTDRLNQAIAVGSRQKRRVALLFFDLDGFKKINDQLGHANGDIILREVAQRLSMCLRTEDTACRYGGDEFVVMLTEVEGQESTSAVEQKIRTILENPYVIEGSQITVTASIGYAVYPEDGENNDSLIERADSAMYHVKSNGGTPPNVRIQSEAENKTS